MTLAIVSLCILAGATALIDPFFHYHKPLDSLEYIIDNQRYQNDGIIRHFDYDGMIIGTSMTEYFKTSELDALFGTRSIKVPYSGASWAELNKNIRLAIQENPDLKQILCSIDDGRLYQDRGYMRYECPEYLYDTNLFNDVSYLLNKEILCNNTIRVLQFTRSGHNSTSFDNYLSGWGGPSGSPGFSKEAILQRYTRPAQSDSQERLTPELRQRVTENLTENTIALALENPDIQFYYFFPPYSILYWDKLDREGTMERELETFRLVSQLLTGIENIHLFSFHTDFDTITNLDHYCDVNHYSTDINSLLLQRMAEGEYQLTEENMDVHWQAVADFYRSYDYDALYNER